MQNVDLVKKAAQIRATVLGSICNAGVGATGASMSVVEILTALYYGEYAGKHVVSLDREMPGSSEQDLVLMSKWRASVVQYAILADLGFFPGDELEFYGRDGALLDESPSKKVPGISAPGSDFGLSVACGLAMSMKADRNPKRVFCVMDDEEFQRGDVWGAVTSAAHFKLDNLTVMVDVDKMQKEGTTAGVMDIGDLAAKLEAFGWKVFKVIDGHDFEQILNNLIRSFTVTRRPCAVLCQTVAGKGVPFAERKHGYLNVPLSENEFKVISHA